MAEPDWSQLSHTYGSAEDLPEILQQLAPDPGAVAWGELWERVYHQGTTYTASPYVLPYLLEAATGWSAPGRVMPLALASSIVSSREFRGAGFEETIEGLRILASEIATERGISRSDRIYVMGALLTLGGNLLWGPALERLNDEEFCGTCPHCGGDLFFTIGDLGFHTAIDFHPQTHSEPIVPRRHEDLAGMGRWLFDLATAANDHELARRIRHVFGTSLCLVCDAQVDVAEAIEKFESTPYGAEGSSGR